MAMDRKSGDTPWGGTPGPFYADSPQCEICWHGHKRGEVCVECLREGIYCDREKAFPILGPAAVRPDR